MRDTARASNDALSEAAARNEEIAKALFEALGQDDERVRKLFAPNMCARQNNGPSMNLEALLTFNTAGGQPRITSAYAPITNV